MKLKHGSFQGMAIDIIQSDSKIVVFGCGVIGNTVVPEILKEQGIVDRLALCVDNDASKWNTSMVVGGKTVFIYPPDSLRSLPGNIAVLIAVSRLYDVCEQLRVIDDGNRFSCYIIPSMCMENYRSAGNKGVTKTSETALIPKRIHYMWLGNKPLPQRLQTCIDSWRRFCPDYEIIKWDEKNYDVHKNRFVAQAYDNGLYGFVPDYARIELLYEHGGIYLDTDVEVIKKLDELLFQEAFCGVEKWQVLNFGGCSGAVKGHKSLEPFLEKWQKRRLVREDGTLDKVSSGLIDTSVALDNGYVVNGLNQTVNGMAIYTYDYFHPYDYMSGQLSITNDTFSIHHFSGGWLEENTGTSSKLISAKSFLVNS